MTMFHETYQHNPIVSIRVSFLVGLIPFWGRTLVRKLTLFFLVSYRVVDRESYWTVEIDLS